MVGPEDRACSSFCSELLRFLFFAPKLLLHPGAGRAQVVGHEGGRSRGADLVGHMRRELLDAAGDAAGDAAASAAPARHGGGSAVDPSRRRRAGRLRPRGPRGLLLLHRRLLLALRPERVAAAVQPSAGPAADGRGAVAGAGRRRDLHFSCRPPRARARPEARRARLLPHRGAPLVLPVAPLVSSKERRLLFGTVQGPGRQVPPAGRRRERPRPDLQHVDDLRLPALRRGRRRRRQEARRRADARGPDVRRQLGRLEHVLQLGPGRGHLRKH